MSKKEFEDIKKFINRRIDILDNKGKHWIGILRSVKKVNNLYQVSIDYKDDDVLIIDEKEIVDINLCLYI